jgi:hypothetical protein
MDCLPNSTLGGPDLPLASFRYGEFVLRVSLMLVVRRTDPQGKHRQDLFARP